MTERLPFHFSLSCIGEGNGNPLQCSCLENPRDSGAWLAAVYGVAQSRTQLKWLSSSSLIKNKQTKLFVFPTLTFPYNILCSALFYTTIFGDHPGLYLHHDSEARFLNNLHWLKTPLFPMEKSSWIVPDMMRFRISFPSFTSLIVFMFFCWS